MIIKNMILKFIRMGENRLVLMNYQMAILPLFILFLI